MVKQKTTLRTYGRHRQRVIAADIWSSDDEKKKNVFSFSTSNSDTQDSSAFSEDSRKRPQTSRKKSGKINKENRYKKKAVAKKYTKKRQKSIHIYSDNKTSESSSASDRFTSSIEAPNYKRRVLRDRNNVDYSETRRKPTLSRLALRNNHKKKIDKENSGPNFSEFDEYSFVFSDSSLRKKNDEDSLLTSPLISSRGHGKDSCIAINIETSTPFTRRERWCNTKSKIAANDISHIEAVKSPFSDSSLSTDIRQCSFNKLKPNEDVSIISVNSLSPSVFSRSSGGDIHVENDEPSRETELKATVPDEHAIYTKECRIQLERLGQSLIQKIQGGTYPAENSLDHLQSSLQISVYSDNSKSLFDSIEPSNITEEISEEDEEEEECGEEEEEVDDGDEEGDEEVEEEEEEGTEGGSADESSLSDIQENSEDDIDSSFDDESKSKISSDISSNVSRYMLHDNVNRWDSEKDSISEMSIRTCNDSDNVYHTAESTDGGSASYVTANRSLHTNSIEFLSPPRTNIRHSQVENLDNSFAQILTPNRKRSSIRPLSPKSRVFQVCEQHDIITFTECLPKNLLNTCVKIGEGVYGEVFRAKCNNKFVAIKIIPIEGDFPVNDEPQKTFEEILPEIVITSELSALRNFADNNTDNFIEVNNVSCVRGKYPDFLLKQWDLYDEAQDSENDRPDVFGDRQLFIMFEFADGGCDLESYKFRNVLEAKSVLQQVTYSLAVAEEALEFEHRDLHWGNVLVRKTTKPVISYTIHGEEYQVTSNGVEVSIIDFTLSRLKKDGCTVYCDLAEDKTLFTSKGDYQFDIYRMMKEFNKNVWEPFNPHTNVMWLHYLADKLVKKKKYSQSRATRDVLREFRQFINDCLSFTSAKHLVFENDFIKL